MINYFLLNTEYLMSEYNRNFEILCTSYIVPLYILSDFFECHRVMCLFNGIDGVSFVLECLYGIEGLFVILPLDALFCA